MIIIIVNVPLAVKLSTVLLGLTVCPYFKRKKPRNVKIVFFHF